MDYINRPPPTQARPELIAFQLRQERLQLALINAHEMPLLRIGARSNVFGKFGKRPNPFPLKAIIFRSEVAVGLGVARHVATVAAEHVVGKQILGVAACPRPHRQHQHGGSGTDCRCDVAGNDLNFGGKGSSRFQRLYLPPDIDRACRRLADGPKPTGPGGLEGIRPTWPQTGIPSSRMRRTVERPAAQ